MKTKLAVLIFLIAGAALTSAQPLKRDTAVFIEKKNEFFDSIKTTLDAFYKKESTVKKGIAVNFGTFDSPHSISEFTSYRHNPPVSQAVSGMCWCFSTTSFFESEIFRLYKRNIKLSELYTVYWEYVEKARGYIKSLGSQEFGEGSESDAVIRIWKNHGIVPASAYTGLLNGQPFHDHRKMFEELKTYLESVKASKSWDIESAERVVRTILNKYIGAPPEKITVDGKEMTPQEYLKKVVKLDLDEYIEFVSLSDRPYYQWTEYDVPDNWWHSKAYFNVPLNDFMSAVKSAIRAGYTIAIGGDVTEPGIYGCAGIAVIPTFDIPSEYIDESSRIFRFKNGTTGDDHGVHLVGYVEKNGRDWYLVKDSGSGSRNNSHPGYYFFHEDFVKLKMLSVMLHKSAVRNIISKIK
ncbi:MAG: peptidase C1 [Bacteroidetes bacterium]|nr:peptidase C1 [Bacteroidota bacterium]